LALTCGGEFRLSSLSLKSSLKSKERRQRNCFKWSLKVKKHRQLLTTNRHPTEFIKEEKKGGEKKKYI
jgi:hypothetical protein